MEVKLTKTLVEWQEAYTGCQALMQETSVPFEESYWIARSVDRIESAIKHLDKIRRKMLDDFCDRDEENKPIMLDPPPGIQGQQYSLVERGLEFSEAWKNLMEQEVEVSLFTVSWRNLKEKMPTIAPTILKGALSILSE